MGDVRDDFTPWGVYGCRLNQQGGSHEAANNQKYRIRTHPPQPRYCAGVGCVTSSVLNPIVLVLADPNDAGAASVAAAVRTQLGQASTRVQVWGVRPESLGQAIWSHAVDDHGQAHTRVALAGRPVLDSGQICAVFNRVQHLPVPQSSHASVEERSHAELAFQALVQGWLAVAGGTVVPALKTLPWITPQLPWVHWASAALRCGLPVAVCGANVPARPWDATVLVAGPYATGILAARFGAACVATAQAMGYSLLEFRFARASGMVELVDVSSHPDLSDLEDIDTVARYITGLVPALAATA
jgi:hypothetical protein